MSILYLLIPLSLILLGFAVWAFFWAVKSGQFDDLEGPAHRIIFDEDDNDLTPEQRRQRQAARRDPTDAAADGSARNDTPPSDESR